MGRQHKTVTTETSDAGVGEVLGLYQEVAGAVSGAGLTEAIARVLDRVCSFAGWPVGYGLVDPFGDNRAEVWHLADDDRFKELIEAPEARTPAAMAARRPGDTARAIPQPGAGLVERVLTGGSLVSIEDLATDAELPEAEAAMEAGLRAAYAIPIFAGEEIAAVLAFFAEEPGPMPPGFAEAVEFTAKQLEVIAGSEKAQRAVQAAARQARAQAVELNRMAAQLRVSGAPAGDGMYDALTGFPRRRLLLDRLQQAFRRCQRNPELQFAVACVGLEGMKDLRNELGLRASEELLLALCRRMVGAVRPADTIARTAEHEFTIILEDTEGLDDSRKAAERLQSAICRPYRAETDEVSLRAHIGLALSAASYEHGESILQDALAALRASRAFGDEHPRVFDLADQPRLRPGRVDDREIERAVEDGELRLEYRPVVSLASGRVAGFESHVRWKHPERGVLAPEEFLPESGSGRAASVLLSWTLEQVCRQALEWQSLAAGTLPYAAPLLTSEQFFGPELVSATWDALTATGLEGRGLRFVVDESVLMRSPAQAAQVLVGLGALEVGVVIDAFGTSSSLPHLHELRPAALRIERAFLTGASAAPRKWLVARMVVELARILDAEVHAAGVDSRERLAALFHLGCEFAQGPHFGGGVSAEKTAALLRGGFAAEVEPLVRLGGGGGGVGVRRSQSAPTVAR